jgi:hypothetical protein
MSSISSSLEELSLESDSSVLIEAITQAADKSPQEIEADLHTLPVSQRIKLIQQDSKRATYCLDGVISVEGPSHAFKKAMKEYWESIKTWSTYKAIRCAFLALGCSIGAQYISYFLDDFKIVALVVSCLLKALFMHLEKR